MDEMDTITISIGVVGWCVAAVLYCNIRNFAILHYAMCGQAEIKRMPPVQS